MKYTQEELDAMAEEARKEKLIETHDLVGKDLVMGTDASANIKELEKIAKDFEAKEKACLDQLGSINEAYGEAVQERNRMHEELSIYKSDLKQVRSDKRILTSNLKEAEKEVTKWRAAANSQAAEILGFQKENKTIGKALHECHNEKDILQAEIEVLKSPRDEGHNLAVIKDLKKEVEIQSAKVIAAEIHLAKWREWATDFPKV